MSMFTNAFPPQPDGRTRYVNKLWLRDPQGPLIKKPPPLGVRTPSALIWGHDLNDFFWLQRIPGQDIMTIWSRSMIKHYGENYDEKEFKQSDSTHYPRRRHPWPVLKVPKEFKKWETPLVKEVYGIIDPGCEEHADIGYLPKYRDEDGEIAGGPPVDEKFDELVKRVLGFDNNGVYRRNDPKNPVKDYTGRVYSMLWSTHIRDAVLGRSRAANLGIPLQTMRPFPFTLVQMDHVGLHVITTMDDDGLEELGGPSLPLTEEEWKAVGNNFAEGHGPTPDEAVRAMIERQSAHKPDTNKAESSSTATSSATAAVDKQKTNSQDVDVAMTDETDKSESADSKSSSGGAAADEKSNVKGKGKNKSPPACVEALAIDELTEGDAHAIPLESPYSVEDIPKLEEFLPIEYYPDYLHVHDPNSVTTASYRNYGYRKQGIENTATIVYKRVFPKLPRDPADSSASSTPTRVAQLHLAQTHRFGVGHHSLVHHAPLTLPEPLSAHSRNGRVVVAAKSAFNHESARHLLNREAKIYNAFPRHLSEDWCGFNLVTPCKHPVPVGPVVPKFYGFYVPVKMEDGKEVLRNDEKDFESPSPILLMEECGNPVKPEKFTADQRYV